MANSHDISQAPFFFPIPANPECPTQNDAQQKEKLQLARNIAQAYQGTVKLEQILAMSFERVQQLYNEIVRYYIQNVQHAQNHAYTQAQQQQAAQAARGPNNTATTSNPSNINALSSTNHNTPNDASRQQQQRKLQMARNIAQSYQGRVTVEQVLAMSFERVLQLHNEIVSRLNQSSAASTPNWSPGRPRKSTTSHMSMTRTKMTRAGNKRKAHRDIEPEEKESDKYYKKRSRRGIIARRSRKKHSENALQSPRKNIKKKSQKIRKKPANKVVKPAENIYVRYSTKHKARTTRNSIRTLGNTQENVCLRRKDILSAMKSKKVNEGMREVTQVLYSSRKDGNRRRRKRNVNRNDGTASFDGMEIEKGLDSLSKSESQLVEHTHGNEDTESHKDEDDGTVAVEVMQPPIQTQKQSPNSPHAPDVPPNPSNTNAYSPTHRNINTTTSSKKRPLSDLDDMNHNEPATMNKRFKTNINDGGSAKDKKEHSVKTALEHHFKYTLGLEREINKLRDSELKLRNQNRIYRERLRKLMDLIRNDK